MQTFQPGDVALITGASHGIGEGVARRLAESGAKLLLSDIDDARGEALAAELGAVYVHGDTSSLEDNEALVATALEHYGQLDLTFLNAGISSGCGVDGDFDLVKYRRAMGINLDGIFFGVHAALPALKANCGGQIIATASLAGLVAVPFDPIYAANKHAVVGLVRSLGVTLNPADNVRANALCPSFAKTNIITEIKPFLEANQFPILEVSDVVDTFMQIATDDTTGQCYYVVPGRDSEPFAFRNAPGPRL